MSEQAIVTTAGPNGTTEHYNAWQTIIPGVSQVVAFTGTSAQSTALQASTTLVRVTANADCFLAFGSSPTANTTSSYFLPSGAVEYIGVTPSSKIAVIQSSASGNLYITEGL